jgi:hypothetical protein
VDNRNTNYSSGSDNVNGVDFDKLMIVSFVWDKRESILKLVSKEICVKFALFCAKQNIHIFEQQTPHDSRLRLAIQAAERWLEGSTNHNAAYAAAAAHAASTAAYASYAAAACAALAAADAAYAAANAADAAAAYAAYAAYASYAASYAAAGATNKETLKQEQMDYLRELIIKNLPEEDRDCWLLVASI